MSELTWLDSAGVGALVQLLVRRSKSQHSLALAALSPRNYAVLQVAQVLKLFSVHKTADEAAASLAQNPNAAQRST
jgi:anti-anti-sigma factor